MHEYGLCDPIVEAILARAGERKVARVKIRVGVFHHVVGEAFEHAFEHAAEGTVVEGATVELVEVPARGQCAACGKESEVRDMLVTCSHCGSDRMALSGGDDLMLESIEYAAPVTR